MCGIAGIAQFDGEPVQEELLWKMLKWLDHRGPDEAGVWRDGNVGMGTTRLSILDLVSGRQPIANEDETVWVSFNGEIYNFLDLRRTLEQKGHRFRTRTDTEVVVHAYEEWNEDFIRRLKGMFGFALVDLHAKRLFLARDISGEKPLFYTQQARFFAFASELKSLLHELPISRETDPLAIQSFFAFSRPVGELCVFRAIRKLLPAQILRLDLETGKVSITDYWHASNEKAVLTLEEAEKRLLRLLEDAVERFLIADVPVGAFLSGGTDSSAVVAMMRECFDQPVKTFTAVYDDPHISEAQEAQRVAAVLGTDHHEILIRPDDVFKAIPKLIWHLEEPFADASFIPAYFVAQRARQFVKVALTGDGGDELFGGYDSYLAWRMLEIYRRLPRRIRAAGKGAVDTLSLQFLTPYPKIYHYFSGLKRVLGATDGEDDIAAFQALTGDTSLPDLISGEALQRLLKLRRASLNGYEGENALDRILFFQFRGLLPELFFTKVDRMSMANSLECRSPLVYRDVMEFALRLPVALKIRGTRRKYLLKRVFEKFLPRDILYRPKKGFTIPFYRWLREEANLRKLVETYALGQRASFLADLGGVNHCYLREVTQAYLARKHNHWVLPWKAVCFGIWLDTFVERSGRTPLEDLTSNGLLNG
ncbi:MAG: asparagine synthase (glutamine-hydrolyzing) [Deltaproteobacteria bacterium]|nr:asparagine synthase (glutamine-hydrolyzing) [Deltaproteobacteria bacterium]